MASIKHSERYLDPHKIKELEVLARRIDADEGADIRARGRTVFRRHDQLRSLINDLRDQRKSQGLSLADVALRSGISKPNLSRLENNTHAAPTLDTLQRYAQAMGMTVRLQLAAAEAA